MILTKARHEFCSFGLSHFQVLLLRHHIRRRSEHRILHRWVRCVALRPLEIEQRAWHQLILRIVRVTALIFNIELSRAHRAVTYMTTSAFAVHAKVLRVATITGPGARKSINIILHEVNKSLDDVDLSRTLLNQLLDS